MTWATTAAFDVGSADVGTATAVWTESGSPSLSFTYTARVKADNAGANAFVAAAIAARNAWQAGLNAGATGATTLLNKLNAADPQVA